VHHCKFGLSKDVHILRLYALPLEELNIDIAKAISNTNNHSSMILEVVAD
jgi:hypothetical protein